MPRSNRQKIGREHLAQERKARKLEREQARRKEKAAKLAARREPPADGPARH